MSLSLETKQQTLLIGVYMKHVYFFSVLIILVLITVNCGGNKDLSQTGAGDVPEWFLTTPTDPNYIFVSRTATSQDMQLAIDKATTDARAEIARTIEIKMEGLQKRFDEEVGVRENATLLSQYTQATKTVVSESISGSEVKEKTISKDGDIWRAYVLVQYPIGAANDALVKQLRKQEEIYTRIRSTETFNELETEVQKYEEWKKQQDQK